MSKHGDAMKDAGQYFRIPHDYAKNYSKYNGVKFSSDFKVGFGHISLNRLNAAGRPSNVGEHVLDMQKRLQGGLKTPPIAVQIERNGRVNVVDGNTRVLALKRMGVQGKVPAVVAAVKASDLAKVDEPRDDHGRWTK